MTSVAVALGAFELMKKKVVLAFPLDFNLVAGEQTFRRVIISEG